MLLVDDDEAILRAFEKALARAGHRVVATRSPDVALDMVERARSGHFDLAVIDIFLGARMSGLELARKVARIEPRTPILVVSSLLGREPPPHGLPVDRVEFLPKPVGVNTLIDTVNRLCRRSWG